jgi:hypothetical protein
MVTRTFNLVKLSQDDPPWEVQGLLEGAARVTLMICLHPLNRFIGHQTRTKDPLNLNSNLKNLIFINKYNSPIKTLDPQIRTRCLESTQCNGWGPQPLLVEAGTPTIWGNLLKTLEATPRFPKEIKYLAPHLHLAPPWTTMMGEAKDSIPINKQTMVLRHLEWRLSSLIGSPINRRTKGVVIMITRTIREGIALVPQPFEWATTSSFTWLICQFPNLSAMPVK